MSENFNSSTKNMPKGLDLANIVMNVEDCSKEGTGSSVVKGYNVSCPNCGNFEKWLPRSQGVTNALQHWQACVKEQAYSVYMDRLALKTAAEEENIMSSIDGNNNPDGGISSQTTLRASTNWHRSLLMWIEEIVLLNNPVEIVENKVAQSHMKYPECKSTKTVLDAAFHLVEIAEEKITKMMKNSDASQVIYDGWTKNGTHFLGVYCSFMNPKHAIVNREPLLIGYGHECRLLAVSPMPILRSDRDTDEEDEVEDEEAINFDAEHHVNHLKETLSYYDKEICGYVKCQLADSAAVNIKASKLMGIPHISCKNHNLSLESNAMVARDSNLRENIEKITAFAAKVRGSAKASTALRNSISGENKHSSVRAKKKSVTRQWIGEERAVGAHIKLKEHFEKLIQSGVNDLDEHAETVEHRFIEKVKKQHIYMEQIRRVSCYLQTNKLLLHKAESALQILIHKVESGSRRQGSRYYSCELKRIKISNPNGLSTHPHFESGVCKIQQGVPHEIFLTREEVIACNSLLKTYIDEIPRPGIENDEASNGSEDDISTLIEKQEKRKYQEVEGKSKYINCGFIMGSAAIVERLWSKADCIYTKRRAGLSPLVFEMIMFLKDNSDLWSIKEVVEADDRRKETNRNSRANRRIHENNEIEEMQVVTENN